MTKWYHIKNIEDYDSPALVAYPERIKNNIAQMLNMVGSPEKLRPHVKTYKMKEVVQLQREAGIQIFKCATIPEAEMLAQMGVKDILLAYQPVGPKIKRLFQLSRLYPEVQFAALVDAPESAHAISSIFRHAHQSLHIYLDIDVGMQRTGIPPNQEAVALYQLCSQLKGIQPVGLHIYDGHLRDSDLINRQKGSDEWFIKIQDFVQELTEQSGQKPKMVVGGTPSFPTHARRVEVTCSPGTCLLWDWGYNDSFPDLKFQFAALVICRIISKMGKHRICVDLGHKSVAAEKPLPRVKFLNLEGAKAILQSEEHLVLEVENNEKYPLGMVLYGVPKHICPTCALYENALVVENGAIVERWEVVARDRRIQV